MSKNKPNILIIHADQHRSDCLGCYGNNQIKTPNIDKLAEDGVMYNNCFCTLPICTPSRYSFITGLYPHQHLGWTNHSTIPKAIKTFPNILKENGYNTKAIGKMHFTPTYLDVGFKDMQLAEQDGPGRYDDDYHKYLKENELIDYTDLMDQVQEYRQQATDEYWNSFGAVKSNLEDKDHSTSWIGGEALDTLGNWSDSGNLLMVGFIKPHHPFDPPEPWCDMYSPEELSVLPGWTDRCIEQDINKNEGYFPHIDLDQKKIKNIMSYYYGSISQIDHFVGEMIRLLKEQGIYENTMIIYTSDHGDYMGYHHMLLKGNYMYDPLMKIPLVIKYPENINKGTVVDSLINNLDCAPTILKQAGCDIDNNMKGFDLSITTMKKDYVFSENINKEDYMVRSTSRKLLLCKDDRKSQFFDLEEDPYEMNNLYYNMEYKEEIKSYKDKLFNWILFEAQTPSYLDEDAEVIKGDNIPTYSNNSRKESELYFKNKF